MDTKHLQTRQPSSLALNIHVVMPVLPRQTDVNSCQAPGTILRDRKKSFLLGNELLARSEDHSGGET